MRRIASTLAARARAWLAELTSASAPRTTPTAHLPFLPDAVVDPIRPRRRPELVPSPRERPPSIDPRPEISIVLGSYNRRVLLERAVDSVRANLAGLSGEIIVVDGGSTDGSIEWLVSQRDIVSVIQHNRYEQRGQTRRRMTWGQFMNIGFRAAGAERVAMISDDCYLLLKAIPSALARMDEAQRAGVPVGACAFYFRNWPQDEAYYVQRTLGGNLMVNHGVYTRAALIAAGYANEDDYAFYKADSDLSLAIWQAGYAIIDAPGSICEHFMSPEEAARISNNATLEFDREQLRKRWPELVSRAGTRKMGRQTLDWQDAERTAERVFGDQVQTSTVTSRVSSGAT